MANIATYKIQFKSDFVLTIHGDAGWTTPFCIKFWTGAPSQAYFVGWDGKEYINCKVDETDASRLIVLFDDHQLPVGQMKMQMAWHTTIADFPNASFDEVMNQMDVVATVEGEDKHVELAFEGETDPEVEYFLPAYAAEAQRQAAERERERVFTEQMQAAATATQDAENVDAELSGTVLTVTNRHGESKSVDTKGQDGVGVPSGGLTGQVLKKKSDSNYDTEWGEGGGVGNVESVNGRTGVVVLDANDVGALPADTEYQSPINDLESIRSGAALGATAIQNVKKINLETITGTGNVLTTKVVPYSDANYNYFISLVDAGVTDLAILYNHIVHRLTYCDKSSTTLVFEGIGYKNGNPNDKKGISIITIIGSHKSTVFIIPQSEILDLATIRSGAALGATAYQKPSGGIPKTDLASAVQTSLGKADTALQTQKQADWDVSDTDDPAFIKNKPTIPESGGSAYVPTLNAAPTSSTTTYTKDGQTVDFEIGQFARVAKQGGGYDFYQLYDLTTSDNVTTATWMMLEQVPDNVACISNDSGVGIVPEDGIRAESIVAGATMSVNADVVTVINGTVGTATITLQVPNDNLAHVWDILMTTDSTVAITFAMSNSETILYPNGFSICASKDVEISVIGKGSKYYLRYGEFA